MADLNEAITSNEKTHQTFSELGLFNVMLERIGPNLPATRIPGSKAIDHVYCTSDILNNNRAAGFAPLNNYNISDHRALVLDIDFHHILDKDLISIKGRAHRRLTSGNAHGQPKSSMDGQTIY